MRRVITPKVISQLPRRCRKAAQALHTGIIHEAGHCLAAYLVGTGITGVEVDLPKWHFATVYPGYFATGHERLDAEVISVGMMAGVVAERVWLFRYRDEQRYDVDVGALMDRDWIGFLSHIEPQADLYRALEMGLLQATRRVLANNWPILARLVNYLERCAIGGNAAPYGECATLRPDDVSDRFAGAIDRGVVMTVSDEHLVQAMDWTP